MKSHIIVNELIVKDYKDDILNLNVRLFTNKFYYDLENYQIPLDLKGIENHLSFIDEVVIYTSTTFIDYVNVLLVLSFLRSNSYCKNITIKYYNFICKDFLKDNFLNISLTNKEYDNVDYLLTLLKLKKVIKEDLVSLPGSYNFINFINMINNHEYFIESLQEVIEHYYEDIDNIASYLANKYSHIGLNKQYYLDYLEKYM
jgi:hypothetical protein